MAAQGVSPGASDVHPGGRGDHPLLARAGEGKVERDGSPTRGFRRGPRYVASPGLPIATAIPEVETAPEVVNRQSKVEVDLRRARAFLRRLLAALDLKGCGINVGFVDDGAMSRLNAKFRGQAKATDVLSFAWQENPDLRFEISDLRWPVSDSRNTDLRSSNHQIDGFLGDIVISAESARRNARREGHSTEKETRWLILHGALHLCGFDHERDGGEMTALELRLRERLRI